MIVKKITKSTQITLERLVFPELSLRISLSSVIWQVVIYRLYITYGAFIWDKKKTKKTRKSKVSSFI